MKLRKSAGTLEIRAVADSMSIFLQIVLGGNTTVDIETWDDSQIPPKYRRVMSRVSGA